MKKEKIKKEAKVEGEDFPGYRHYPTKEDIYNQEKEEEDIDPEDLTKKKTSVEDPDLKNEKDFDESLTGEDLDIPGNEQDEENLTDVFPDEENNYYSLGGDERENIDENVGRD